MYKDKKLFVNTQPVFQRLLPSISDKYVTSTPLGDNQWTFIDTDRSVRINSIADKNGFITIPLGSIRQGDIIQLDFQSIIHNGSTGIEFYLQRYVNDAWSNVISRVFPASSDFKAYNFKHMSVTDNDYRILLGVGSSIVQEYSVRDLVVLIKQIPTINLTKLTDIKSLMLQKTAGVWGVRTDSASDDVTLTVVNGTVMQITFTKPFNPLIGVGSLKPIVACGVDYTANGYKYEVRIGSTNTKGFKFRIYDKTAPDDTPLYLTSGVDDGVALYFIAVDYYDDLTWV